MAGRGRSAGGNICSVSDVDTVAVGVAVGAIVVGVAVGVMGVTAAVGVPTIAAVATATGAVAVRVGSSFVAEDCGTAGKVWVGCVTDAWSGVGVRLSIEIPTVSLDAMVFAMVGVGLTDCLISGKAQADKLTMHIILKNQKKKWMFFCTLSSWLSLNRFDSLFL